MNIKEAIKILKQPPDFSLNYYERENAIDIVLNELEKKDKVIDMMAEQIRASDIDENICKLITEPTECVSRDCKCENCIKEYFYKKAEEK